MKRKTSLKTLRLKAWKACSLYVRQVHPAICYTCGAKSHWKSLHAGHAIPGRTNSVLLDTEIIRPQCPVCNIWKGGMHHVFATKLIKENGLDWWEKKLIEAKKTVKYARSDYETLTNDFNSKVKDLK